MSDQTKIENPSPELNDEALDSVNGGVHATGGISRKPYCKTCGKDVTPEYRGDGGYCPYCGNRV